MDNFRCVFTYDAGLLKLDDRFRFAPAQGTLVKHHKRYNKSKLVSLISSDLALTPGHRERLRWVEKLKDKVDLFGRGFNPISYKEDGLCDYMFSVAIENSRVENYHTEKVHDCFATGTIPIYFGCPNIGDFFNPEGIIILDQDFDPDSLTSELYFSKMHAVMDNLERVRQYDLVEDYIYEKYFATGVFNV